VKTTFVLEGQPQDGLQQTRFRDPATRFLRVLLFKFRPLQSEGAGNAGRPVHPQPRVRYGVLSMHTSIHSEFTGIDRHSPRNGFTAYGVLASAVAFSTVTG